MLEQGPWNGEGGLACEYELLSMVIDRSLNRWAQRLQTHGCGLLCYSSFVSDGWSWEWGWRAGCRVKQKDKHQLSSSSIILSSAGCTQLFQSTHRVFRFISRTLSLFSSLWSFFNLASSLPFHTFKSFYLHTLNNLKLYLIFSLWVYFYNLYF